MNLYTLDFETHWSQEYSLSKMSSLEYVKDSRFEVICMSVKDGNKEATRVFFGPDIPKAIEKFEFNKSALLAHNMSGFDAMVLAYHYNVVPKLWLCTLAMARPKHAETTGVSLRTLVDHYKVGTKKDAVLHETKGKRYADFTTAERLAMARYCAEDTDQCFELFKILKKSFSAQEIWAIDATVRMRTEPQFVVDKPLLATTLALERARKEAALRALYVKLEGPEGETHEGQVEYVRERMASSAKFSEILVACGEEVPLKPSPTNPEKMIPALAKTDPGLLELTESNNDVVATAARMRIDVKSTQLETRALKFLAAATLADGRLPVPIKVYGASTGRDSGEEYNPQNLPRINPKSPKPADALRRSLMAPEGHLVYVSDQSAIELRINHFLWKVESTMELYRASPSKADLYREFAGKNLYNKYPSEVDSNERQIGKISQLGLGFGAGAVVLSSVAKKAGVILPVESEDPEALTALRVVGVWRSAYLEIVAGWRRCMQAIQDIHQGLEREVDPWGLVHTCAEGLRLPSGRILYYPNLRQERDGEWPDGRPRKSWFYGEGRHRSRLTGPKMDENIVQALARDSLIERARVFYNLTGKRPVLRVHDELVYIGRKGLAEKEHALLQTTMQQSPSFWPDLVVWSEGGIGANYGDAK